PAAEWEAVVLPARIEDYHPEWLDHPTLTGELGWGRLWGGGKSANRSPPGCLLPPQSREARLPLPARRGPHLRPTAQGLSTYARTILDTLEARGACFTQELERTTRLLPSHLEMGLGQLIGQGLVTCDSFGGLRRLVTPPSRRRGVTKRLPLAPAGRWSRCRAAAARPAEGEPEGPPVPGEREAEFGASQLLARYGVVFKRLIDRERIPVPWRDLVRVYRRQELRGEVRGGRFVQRF